MTVVSSENKTIMENNFKLKKKQNYAKSKNLHTFLNQLINIDP